MKEIMNSKGFKELAVNIVTFLCAAKRQRDFAELFQAVKSAYEQCYINALYGKNAKRFEVYHGNRCALIHLYLNWPFANSVSKNRAELQRIVSEINSDYVPAQNVQICQQSIEGIMQYAEQRYSFCEKLLGGSPLNILLSECSHARYNSLCRTGERMNGSVCCTLYLFHLKEDCAASPEYVLFHELGHVLHTMITGSYNKVPDSFFEMAEPMFPGLSTTYRDSAPEFFADCFAMGAMLDFEWSKYDPLEQIYTEDKRLFEQYIRSLLE